MSNFLDDLSDDQLDALKALLDAKTKGERKRKRGGGKRKNNDETRLHRRETTVDPPSAPALTNRRKRKPPEQTRKGRERPCRQESVSLAGKRNQFLDIIDTDGRKLADQHKKDADIDKLLIGQNQRHARRPPPVKVEAVCPGCEYYFQVEPALTFKDKDTGELVYWCNDCASRSKPQGQ